MRKKGNDRRIGSSQTGRVIACVLAVLALGCVGQPTGETEDSFFGNILNRHNGAKLGQKVHIHLPFAERHCRQCHLPARSSDPGANRDESTTFEGQQELSPSPPRLVMPAGQLCMKCHEYGSPKEAYPAGPWLHAPSAQGACVSCHSPHNSSGPNLLRSRSPAICTDQCHLKGYMLRAEVQWQGRDCLDCHNPHMGINSFMLREDYSEIWLQPKAAWNGTETGDLP